MDHPILQEYAKKIPQEIRDIIRGLDDENRLGIIVALLENGKLTFNEMKNKFEISSSSLSNHLSILEEGNLIQNFYEKNDNRVYSYYDVTDIPESIIHSIFDIGFRNNNYSATQQYRSEKDIPEHKESATKAIEYIPITYSQEYTSQQTEAT